MAVTALTLKNTVDLIDNSHTPGAMNDKKLFKDHYMDLLQCILSVQEEAHAKGMSTITYQDVVTKAEDDGIWFLSWKPAKKVHENADGALFPASTGTWAQTNDAVIRRAFLRSRRLMIEKLISFGDYGFVDFHQTFKLGQTGYIEGCMVDLALHNFDYKKEDVTVVCDHSLVYFSEGDTRPNPLNVNWGSSDDKKRANHLGNIYESLWIAKNFIPFSIPDYKARDTSAKDALWLKFRGQGMMSLRSAPAAKKGRAKKK